MTSDKHPPSSGESEAKGNPTATHAPPGYEQSPRPEIRVEQCSPIAEHDGSGDMDPPSSAVSTSTRRTDTDTLTAETPSTEDGLPPPYSDTPGTMDMTQEGLQTNATVADDGRVNININQKTTRLSRLLVPALRHQLDVQQHEQPEEAPPGYIPPSLGGIPGGPPPPPPMNVVIHVVGSRGDVQPFVALGKVLKDTYKHRVRLATHPTFKGFVKENGLEFFSIGGDPAELMAFMVRNPGLMPGTEAIKSGDIRRRRQGMWEIVVGCWRSCFEAGDGTGPAISDKRSEPAEQFDESTRPFVADAIIANPPSFAHLHCAEKLGVPLHLMFTMPWSPTQAFPHPLANIQSSNADANMTNFLTYALVEIMTWQGLGDIINRLREKKLGLEPISMMTGPGIAARLKVPYTYCWSPALIPKPKDWGQHIGVAGFYFLSLAGNYTPAPDLAAFLDAGPPPVYIGFGSIVVEDPNAMTKLIFEAVKKTGQRALVSKGWGGFGADALGGVPDGVFMLGNVPHDWLFRRVSCVVHHGGAGTTAAGIALKCPTVVVPFFGDQPFWGAMVEKAGAGPAPIPNKELTADRLAAAITHALEPATKRRAEELGARMAEEKGTDLGGKMFHDKLDVPVMRCSLAPSRVAVWRVKKTDVRLSAFAATVLVNEGLMHYGEVKLHRPKEHESGNGPLEPISGATGALLGTITSMGMGAIDIPIQQMKMLGKATSSTNESIRRHSPSRSKSKENPSSPDTASLQSPSATTLPTDQSSTGGSTLPTDQSSTAASSTKDGSDASPSRENVQKRSDSGGALLSPSSSHTPSVADSTTTTTNPSNQPGNASPTSPRGRSKSKMAEDLATALGVGRGFGQVVEAGVRSPMDFTLSLAQGFHNAPRLYGDTTVRPPARVTGWQSGARAAAKELGMGFFDGVSGLVTQPLEGAKKGGLPGLVKGFGKGIGGLVLKPGAGIWGIPGYTFKGIYKEYQKVMGASVQNYILAARTAQGVEDFQKAGDAEKRDVLGRWQLAKPDITRQRKAWIRRTKSSGGRDPSPVAAGVVAAGGALAELPSPGGGPGSSSAAAAASPSAQQQAQVSGLDSADPEAFENAIRESVRATSTGDPAQDAMIERALRASVAELQRQQQEQQQARRDGGGGGESGSKGGGDDAAVKRAIQASIDEAERAEREQRDEDEKGGKQGAKGHAKGHEHGEEERRYREQLEAAIQASMRDHSGRSGDVDSSDDEDYKRAVRESLQGIDDLDLSDKQKAKEKKAFVKEKEKESGESDGKKQAKQAGGKSEEEIVMEYVKRQSLAEEEHRQARKG